LLRPRSDLPLAGLASGRGLQRAKDAAMDTALGLVRTRRHARRTVAAALALRLIKTECSAKTMSCFSTCGSFSRPIHSGCPDKRESALRTVVD